MQEDEGNKINLGGRRNIVLTTEGSLHADVFLPRKMKYHKLSSDGFE